MTPQSDLKGICAKDIDQDGDLDIFKIYPRQVRTMMLENTGTPKYPEFAYPVPFISNPGNFKLSRVGILGHCLFFTGEAYVDIDADGDLDLFSHTYDPGSFDFFRNDGTSEHPVYVKKNSQEEFGFSEETFSYMFKDIDHDGDQDLWSSFGNEPIFFENTGSPENAAFVQRNTSPIQPLCREGTELGFIIDLNNDGQWDMLCQEDFEGNIEYFESSNSGFIPKKNLFVNTKTFISLYEAHAFDLDSDGDKDIISGDLNGFLLFTNFGSALLPQYDSGSAYPFLSGELADLDGDGDFDILNRSTLGYSANIGTNINPIYNSAKISTETVQCESSFAEIAIANKGDLSEVDRVSIQGKALLDTDGDNDLDLFIYLSVDDLDLFSNSKNGSSIIASTPLIVYCENVGSLTNPLFAAGTTNAFGFNTDASRPAGAIVFSDMDGDGDQDAWVGSTFFDNISKSTKPLFRHFDNLLFPGRQFGRTLLDLDGDSRGDSIINSSSRLLHKGLEPATDVITTALPEGALIIATNRPSQVQLQACLFNDTKMSCGQVIVLLGTAKKLSLNSGDFTGNGKEDIVLAMIDAEGLLKIKLFDDKLNLIGTGSGGPADSVSVSTGQLDEDPADEYVVALVQSDGRVAAIAFNLDGSRVGKVVANEGKQPTVDVGQFSGTGDGYVLAYLTPENQLDTAIFKGDGTLLGHGTGGTASHIRVTAAELSSSKPGDEYAISLVQADGTVALISFAADGTRLGKVVGGISYQPKVISSDFSADTEQNEVPGLAGLPGISLETSRTDLAASVILSDKKPAIIFLDSQGKHLGTGVGGVAASVATIELLDTNNNGIDDTGVLIYLDKAGNPRIGVFDTDGKRK
jgi:hypothetical protein